jgi:restriction system protein
LVTTGTFSHDAIAFASGKPIQLIDAPRLQQLVSSLREAAPDDRTAPEPTVMIRCPDCGSPMVARTARRGRFAGETFWGCSRYPVCGGTRAVATL